MVAKVQTKRIPDEVLAVFERSTFENGVYKMPQLERKLYAQTNKVLETLGLKWSRESGGHTCADGDDAAERIEDAIQTRGYEKPNRLEFFESRPPVVERIIEVAHLETWMDVLEPEAGNGAIAKAAAAIVGFERVFCVEYFAARIRDLREAGFSPLQADFLAFNLSKIFDRVLMNPPFRHQADIDHVTKAWSYLKPAGRLVSVMSSGTVTRTTSKARVFQHLLDEFGYYEDLPDDSFKASGTGVSTILVVMDKP